MMQGAVFASEHNSPESKISVTQQSVPNDEQSVPPHWLHEAPQHTCPPGDCTPVSPLLHWPVGWRERRRVKSTQIEIMIVEGRLSLQAAWCAALQGQDVSSKVYTHSCVNLVTGPSTQW